MYKILKLIAINFSFFLFFSQTYANNYAVIIDAGSSGSRIYVYEKNEDGIQKINSIKIKPGISAYNINNKLEANRLKERVNNLLSLVKKNLPKDQWSNIGVTLYATAGMRVIPLETQKKTYQLIKNVIENSGLKYNDARTISGGEEGLFMWLSVNSGHNKIDSDYGILDMGGASTQIAFWDEKFANYDITISDKHYKIYSKSFLGLGKNLAISQFLQKPACFPNDYQSSEIAGQWNLTTCENEISRFVITQHDTNNIPTPPQNMTFQASDNFYKVFYQTLGLDSITLSKLDLAKTLSFCQSSNEVAGKTNESDIPNEYLCFDAAYFTTLLASYGFGNQQIQLFDNSWAKGVAFVLLNDIQYKRLIPTN